MDSTTHAQVDPVEPIEIPPSHQETPPRDDPSDLSGAKLRFVEAARQIDPLKPVREHPLMSVGIAIALGALAGSAGKIRLRRVAAASRALQPVLLKAGKAFATAWMARRAAAAASDQSATPETTSPAPVYE